MAVILVAFVSLATYYSLLVPLGEAPDEVPHYHFTRFLATKHALPQADEAGSEGFQPPLYYALGALLTFWVPEGDFLVKANGDFSLARPETSRSLLLHTTAESFPFHDGALAWHLVRLLSVALGAVTVLLTYYIARELFPGAPHLALGAAAVNAFLPGFVFISGAVNNDNLVTTLSAASLLVMIRVAKGPSNWRTLTILGVLIGLAILAKVSALILLPLAALALLLEARRFLHQPSRALTFLLSRGGYLALLVAAVCGWWFARNQILHGDLLGWQFKLDISDVRQTPLVIGDYLHIAQGLFTSFWGRFGGAVQLHLPFSLYLVLTGLTALSFMGFLVWLLKVRRQGSPNVDPIPAVLLLVEALLLAVSLQRWSAAVLGTDQARLLFPGISAATVFIALGLSGAFSLARQRLVLGGLSAGLFVLAAITPSLFIAPAFAAPPAPGPAELAAAQPIPDLVFANALKLKAYHLPEQAVPPGQALAVDLYWETLAKVDADYWLTVELVGQDGNVVAAKDGSPSGGSFTTDLWQPGQQLAARHYLTTPDKAVAGRYGLRVSLHRFGESTPVPLQASGRNQDGGKIVIGYAVLGDKGTGIPLAGQVQAGARFGSDIVLESYGLASDGSASRADGGLRLALRWRYAGSTAPAKDYTVFVHLVDAQGRLVGQADGPPRSGRYPTSIWQPGDVVDDEYFVPLAPQVAPGEHALIVGLYDPLNGERLPVLGADGKAIDDKFKLQSIQVK